MVQEANTRRNLYDLLQARAWLGVEVDRDLNFGLIGLPRDGGFAFGHNEGDDYRGKLRELKLEALKDRPREILFTRLE